MNKKKIIIVYLLFFSSYLILAQQIIDVEMGLSSYVGNYYYQNNEMKDFEYKANHNWYLNLSKSINENILTSAEIRYFPELFEKKLYLYSALVSYSSESMFDFAWEFDRIGLGKTNHIFKNRLNDVRSDQNFITDYRFNGAVLKHKITEMFTMQYRIGGNDLNTGIGAVEFFLNHKGFNSQQSFLRISRDNRFNAQALNADNLTSWTTSRLFIQNMLHTSFLDYYRKGADEKSTVIKDMIETRFSLTSYLQPQFSFYYEAENWDEYKIYEINSVVNIVLGKYEISPAFKLVNYQNSIQREYSLLINYQLHPKWDIALHTRFIDHTNNQDIMNYGLQTKFNLPLTSNNLKSFFN